MIERTALRGQLDSIRLVYGYDFTEYSEGSLGRRIAHFMENRNIPGMDELARAVLRDEGLFESFVQEVTVTVTEMFRDPGFYKSLREKVRTRLATYPLIRVWIAGCATGEEVYSLAILLKEEGLLERSLIYATDINPHSLQKAQAGIYDLSRVAGFTENHRRSGARTSLSDYYTAAYGGVMLDKSLRQHIVFSDHSLATDSVFAEVQLVSCRNVLIYFNRELQDRALGLFSEALCHQGFLGIGAKESLRFSKHADGFVEFSREDRIYQRREAA